MPSYLKKASKLTTAQTTTHDVVAQVLTYLGHHPKALESLLVQSGCSPQDLQEQITTPSFQAGILDFLISHEPLLIHCCQDQNLDPQDIIRARLTLPGVSPND